MNALSDAHYEAIGRLLVARNDFLDRCATVLLVAQFGVTARSTALSGALVCESTPEMIEKVNSYLTAAARSSTRVAFMSVIEPHLNTFREIDRVVTGRWGLVDFTCPERPVLYAKDVSRDRLKSYSVADIQELADRLNDINAALRPLLIESA